MAGNLSSSLSFFNGNAGLANAQVATATGGETPSVSVTLPSATTAQFLPLNLGASTANIKSLFVRTTGNTVTLATNTTTGNQTFSVAPGYPLVWASGMPTANPFTTAVTNGFYLTNPGTTTGTFQADFTVDSGI